MTQQVAILQHIHATVEYYDGLPDAQGNPTGNLVAVTSTSTWASSPHPDGVVIPVSTGKTTAEVTGDTAGIASLTVTEPLSGFSKSVDIQVLPIEATIKSARVLFS